MVISILTIDIHNRYSHCHIDITQSENERSLNLDIPIYPQQNHLMRTKPLDGFCTGVDVVVALLLEHVLPHLGYSIGCW